LPPIYLQQLRACWFEQQLCGATSACFAGSCKIFIPLSYQKMVLMIASVIPKLPFINKQLTLDFYIGQLGFQLDADYGDYVIIHKDRAELHFFAYPTLVPGKSDFMIYLRVDTDIEALYEQWKATVPALERLGQLELKPWGQKEFPLIDPNGTLLTFGQAYAVR
jgi:hypothetical protein